MESIYWVMAWACHRKCRHCYEDKFRPYVCGELSRVVAEAERNTPRVLANLPRTMMYRDRSDPNPDGTWPEKVGRIILSGGEALVDPVRERVTYKVIEGLMDRYRDVGGVKIIVQTTGDLLTPAILRDLLARGVWMVSVAGVDDFHVGMEGPEKQAAFTSRLTGMMVAEGMRASGTNTRHRDWHAEDGPLFSFFGATDETWIGKLWPRGRAWTNGLSRATLDDNFCLNHGFNGAEVSIEPDGSAYPCCIKTKLPIGNLTEEPLIGILDSLKDDPVYQAINEGAPARMGLAHGWSEADFHAKCATTDPKGRAYANLCIGCDKFHEEVLAPRLDAARARRRAAEPVAAE